MTSKEALEKLRNFLGNSPYQKEINIIKQDLDLLNYLIKLAEVKKGKIVIEIGKETNFETYTKIKECIINE